MKRSPLRRKTSLKRKPMRRKLRSTKYSRRERDFDRMAWCKTLPCAVVKLDVLEGPAGRLGRMLLCDGPVEAHHAGEHGVGQKAPDDTVVPLCVLHHKELTDRRGCFAGWPPHALKEWELALIERYQGYYDVYRSTSLWDAGGEP